MPEDYTKGNTKNAASEWRFQFTVSRAGTAKISSEDIDDFWDAVLGLADDHHLFVGGGCKPLLDEYYEELEEDE